MQILRRLCEITSYLITSFFSLITNITWFRSQISLCFCAKVRVSKLNAKNIIVTNLKYPMQSIDRNILTHGKAFVHLHAK